MRRVAVSEVGGYGDDRGGGSGCWAGLLVTIAAVNASEEHVQKKTVYVLYKL